MGMIERIAGWAGFERRSAAADPSWAALSPGSGFHGALSARGAENLSAVLACTNAIASALASVPALVYRRDADGNRVEMPNHPVARLARVGANSQMSWGDFTEHLVASTLLTGNGLALIERGGNGQLAGLRFVPWSFVSVAELSSGRLAFDVSDGRGKTQRYLEGEVIHLRDRTDDGRIGRSRLSRAAGVVCAVQTTEAHARNFMRNGANPAGVIEIPGSIDPEGLERLRLQFQSAQGGAANAGKTMLLSDGMKWVASQITPEDAELLESRKFGVIEICRLFSVPPPIVQSYEHNTFTNSETASRWYATFTLSYWARKIESEFARSVFPSDGRYEIELDLSSFLRGDPETRWGAHKIAIEAGVLDPDEVRQIEGWNPRGSGINPNGSDSSL
ncbi:phage portal protein [Bosea sp. (in: a-proteobacteria)]|uniref:phage portal protein n=1 Tax=Bosea sp. (in: a-proteobacteria) TaxID=1871050 RepID=UPI002B49AB17|nr:phage portal protein [Bosea sp. (in: a-proteobacteria)]WRH58616.1 MAG: phage portal protein [Bosea sp. (in: a-proteobacteria)]